MITTLYLSVVVGWTFGGLGNWLADALPAWRPAVRSEHLPTLHEAMYPPEQVYWLAPLIGGVWRTRPRLPLLIMANIVASVAAVFVTDSWWTLARFWVFAAFLLSVLVIDVEHRRVLNVMIGPAAVVALAASFLPGAPTPAMALLGGAIGFGFFLLLGIIGRGALGAGDVKLMGVIGLMVGFPAIVPTIAAGTLLGGVVAFALLMSRRATRKSTFAYAPWLALGALFVLLTSLGGAASLLV